MPFVKGSPKPPISGRKKGTPNRDRATVAAILDSYDCDPIEGMVKIATNAKYEPALRARMFAELAQYRWPKLRAMELSGPEGSALEISGDLRVIVEYEDKPKPQ